MEIRFIFHLDGHLYHFLLDSYWPAHGLGIRNYHFINYDEISRSRSILLGFAVQLGMYATPIVYPYSSLKNKGYLEIVSLELLGTKVVEAFRYSIFGTGTFTLPGILYSIVFTVIVVFGGMILFNRVERSFMDTV